MTTSSIRRLMAVSAAVLALGLAGCGSDSQEAEVSAAKGATYAASTVQNATLRAGQPVPAPTGKPLITMTGKITTVNKGSSLVLDQALLNKLGLLQVSVHEPWQKKRMDFRGIWLADLLALAGTSDTATTVHMRALDDYEVDVTMAEVRAGGIFVATQAGDGSAMPVSDGGPIRIIFMDGVKSGANQDQWIWSLNAIDLR